MAVQLSDKPEYVDYADVTVEALGFFFFKLLFIRTKLFFSLSSFILLVEVFHLNQLQGWAK